MPVDRAEHEFTTAGGEIGQIREFLSQNSTEAYSIEELTEGLYSLSDEGLDMSMSKALVTAYVNVLLYRGELEVCTVRGENEAEYFCIAE